MMLELNVLSKNCNRPLPCDVIALDGAIIQVPTVFSCIETAMGKSKI